MAVTYESIASQTVSGSSAASVIFSSISGSYTDLIVVANGLSASTATYMTIQFNSDTASNYSSTLLWGTGSAAASGRETNSSAIITYYNAGWTSTIPGVAIFQIMNYANTTTYKPVLLRVNTTAGEVLAGLGQWRKTPEAINSVKINAVSNNFAIGSTFSLYGIKAA